MNNTAVLTTYDLTVGYRSKNTTKTILTDLNLKVDAGTLVAIIGRNGIGKSTLIKTLSGLAKPLAGRIRISGEYSTEISPSKLSKLLGLVTTERMQAGGLTAYEVVSMGRYPHNGFWGRLTAEDHQIVENALSRVGIKHLSDGLIARMSDGERQKVLIAKSLAQETPLILLDEPLAFLDVASRIEIVTLLRELAHDQNKAIIFSTHHIDHLLTLTDQLWIIDHNRNLQTGPTAQMLTAEHINPVFNSPHVTFNTDLRAFIPTSR